MWETSSSDQRACLKHADVGESERSRPKRGSRKSLWRTQKQQQHQQPSRSNPALSPLLTGSGPRKTRHLETAIPKDTGACGGRAVSTLADGRLAVRAVLPRRKPTSPWHGGRKSYLHPRQTCFCTSTPQNQVKESMWKSKDGPHTNSDSV